MSIDMQWEKFSCGLFAYISDYYNRFVKTDYEVSLNITLEQVQKELTEKERINDLSPELKKVAYEYKLYLKHNK